MAEPFIGQIMPMAYSFIPYGWLLCDGSVVSIRDYQALFALVSNRFGGNPAQGTFGLPNLNSAMIIGSGQGTGLSNHTFGSAGGVGSVTLTNANLPAHSHVPFANASANQLAPGNTFTWGGDSSGVNALFNTSNVGLTPLSPTTTLTSALGKANGTIDPHSNIPPILAFGYIICWDGIYPVNPG